MTWWLGLGSIVFTQCRMSLGHFRQKTRVKHIVITSPLGSLLSIFAVYDFMCLPLWVLKLSNFLSPIVLLKLLRMRYILHISVGIGDCTQIPILIQLHILYDFFCCDLNSLATVQMLQSTKQRNSPGLACVQMMQRQPIQSSCLNELNSQVT